MHDTGCSQVHWEILDAERRQDTAMRFNGPRLILGFLLVPLILAQSVVESRAADMAKTVRVAFARAETGFDPQAVADSTSFAVAGAIFDPLYTYDYFARPLRMVPNTAMDLPVISDDGRTYTIKVRAGIYFANDRAFKGKKRELTAYDYVYSIKRIFDPKVRSYWLYVFEGDLVGLDEVLAAARKSGSFDYDAQIEGLQALDRFTLQIRFKQPHYSFVWWLATPALAAVAREVVDVYKDSSNRVMENPVGTGAYRLKHWTRGHHLVLEANTDYRNEQYPGPGSGSAPGDAAIAKGLKGRKLPLVGIVDISIIDEDRRRCLPSTRVSWITSRFRRRLPQGCLRGRRLDRDYERRGIVLHRGVAPSVSYFFFNFEDPLLGGYSPERIALRRAISMGYNGDEAIRLLLDGQGITAMQPIPPPLLRARSKISSSLRLRPQDSQRFTRSISLQRQGWRRLSRNAGWEAVDHHARVQDGFCGTNQR